MHHVRCAAFAMLALLAAAAGTARAQAVDETATSRMSGRAVQGDCSILLKSTPRGTLTWSCVEPAALQSPTAAGYAGARASSRESTTARADRSTASKVFGALVGATGGFFAGGYLGATIEGNSCHCDDPGLKGAVIGAPIGAVVGGILGGMFLF